MKNVTINLLSLIVVFIFYTYQNVLLANGGQCPLFYQESYGMEKDGEKYTYGDFFTPRIDVCSAFAQCNDCDSFQTGDCRYMWPSYYVTYEDVDEKGWPILCGCPTFSCYLPWDPADWSKQCMDMSRRRCFKIPRAPSPPPFCPTIGNGSSVSAKFVIVASTDTRNEILNPMLRVDIKDDLYPTQTHTVKIDRLKVNKEQSFPFNSGARQYKLTAKVTNPLSVEAKLYNENYLIATESIPLPNVTLPKLYAVNNNNSKVSLNFCSSSEAKNLKEDLCSSNSTINTLKSNIEFAVPTANNDSGFYIFKAKMNIETHELSKASHDYGEYASDNKSNLICLSGFPNTPKRYLLKEKIENQQGKKYTKYNWLSDYGIGFQRHAVMIHESKTGKEVKHYILCEDFEPILMEDMTQDRLNGIQIQDGYYVFPENKNDTKTDVNDNPCNQGNRVVYSYGKISKIKAYDSNEKCDTLKVAYSENTNKLFCITTYKDEDTGNPLWKTVLKTDSQNQEDTTYIDGFTIVDPYNAGTCIDTGLVSDIFYTIEPYDKTKQEDNQISDDTASYTLYEEIENPDYDPNCNPQTTQNSCPPEKIKVRKDESDYYLKIEAWGGGGAGYIGNNGYTMGSPGDYVRATLRISKYPQYEYIKIIIGKGAKATSQPMQNNEGGNTEVKLCNNKFECYDFIIAKGGGQQPKLDYEGAFYITTKNATSIPIDEILYPRFSSGLSTTGEQRKIAVPYINDYLSKGIYSTSKCDQRKECYNSTDEDICLKINDNNAQNSTSELASNVYYTWDNSEKEIDKNNPIPGSGGCVNSIEKILQDGASGKVKITRQKFSDK